MTRVPKRSTKVKEPEYCLPEDFDAALYVLLNPDVKYSDLDPATHYTYQGRFEGRLYKARIPEDIDEPARPDRVLPADFDAHVYLDLNPDVKNADLTAEQHYLMMGALEGRQYRRIPRDILNGMVSNPEFDEYIFDDGVFFEELYLSLHPGIDFSKPVVPDSAERKARKLGIIGEQSAASRTSISFVPPVRDIVSMMSRGENLDAFDARSYYYLYPDVMKSLGGNVDSAKSHYIHHGRSEGRIAPGLPRTKRREFDLEKFEARDFGVNIFGPFATVSGLGTAARSLAFAFRNANIPFSLWSFDNTTGQVCQAADQVGKTPRYRINIIFANADLVGRVFAAYPDGTFSDAYNIAIWQWELASFRPDWYYEFDGLDEVWTNSEFQLSAIRAIAPIPVVKIFIPVAVPPKPTLSNRLAFMLPDDAFIFFLPFDIGSTSARKNPFAAIEAFRRVNLLFPNAHLVLKYHGAALEPAFIRALTAALVGVRGVTIISDQLTAAEMALLRASCDCLVSPHRSEGFGLNIAEFMSLGKPVIATNYSGNVDFFDEKVGFPIAFDLTEIAVPCGPYREGYVWAEPELQSIVDQMVFVLSKPDERIVRASAARQRIKTLLSTRVVSDSIIARFKALGLAETAPLFFKNLGKSDILTRKNPAYSLPKLANTVNNKSNPLLSILMPVYNVPPAYLRACIESVVGQTYAYWELCICDDASTSAETLAVLKHYAGKSPQIKIIFAEQNSGISGATNRALSLAVGEYIVFLDNDDLLMPNSLESPSENSFMNCRVFWS